MLFLKKNFHKLIKILSILSFDLFFSIYFLAVGIFIIFFSKKIRKSRTIIYHKNGGFGHQILINQYIRYYYKKNSDICYLLFYNPKRFNKYLSIFLKINHVYIRTSVNFIKNIQFGEYEGSFFKLIEKTLIFFLVFIFKKKVISNIDFYSIFLLKYKKFFFDKSFTCSDFYNANEHVLYYFLCIRYFKFRNPKFSNFFIKKIKKDILLNNKKKFKICTFYLRQKDINTNNFSSVLRNGGKKIEYMEVFKFLIRNNYFIYLIGDKLFSKDDLKCFNNRIIDSSFVKIHKDLYNIYAATNCDLFLSEHGGALHYGVFAPLSIGINFFPNRDKPIFFNHILFKKVKYKSIISDYGYRKKLVIGKNLDQYRLINNTSEEIIKVLKRYIV
jgi:hypothetical protein